MFVWGVERGVRRARSVECVVVVCSGPLRQWENSRLHSLFPLSPSFLSVHSSLSPSLWFSRICVFNKSRNNVAKVHRTHK